MSETEKLLDIACPKCGHQLGPSIDTLPSTVPNLLRINGSVSQLEGTLLKAKLKEVDTNLTQLDIDIERLQVLFASLTQNRERLRANSNLYKGALSAFRRFPPEILSEIFQYFDSAPDFRTAYVPAQVCRLWRDVAFSTASLWTTLDLSLKEGEEELELDMAQQWLARSGELPITFTLGSMDSQLKEPNHPCIQLLAAHAHRWEEATIHLPADTMRGFQSVRHNLPILQSLEIGQHDGEASAQADIVDFFYDAPDLHQVLLYQRFSEQLLKMPWEQLTFCQLDGRYTATECYDLMQNCPELCHCILGVLHDPEPNISHRPLITHPALITLTIHEGSSLESLLDRLKLPNFEELVHEFCESGLSLYATISSLFSRSAPIHRLHLDNIGAATTEIELISCLQQCPALQELTLLHACASGVSKRFLDRLTHTPSRATCCLVPKLQFFEVGVERYFSLEAFTIMIESRWRHHASQCRATDHQAIARLTRATLSRSCFRAVDAIDTEIDPEPPWATLLNVIQAEGFLLNTKNGLGGNIPLLEILLGVDEPESSYT